MAIQMDLHSDFFAVCRQTKKHNTFISTLAFRITTYTFEGGFN